MNEIMAFVELQGWMLIILVVSQLLWLCSVVSVANTKTQDPYDRIVWLIVVLFLNIVGAILYCFFGPEDESARVASEEELKRRVNGPLPPPGPL